MAVKTYFTPEERLEMLLAMHVKGEAAKEEIRDAVSDIRMSAAHNARIEAHCTEAGQNTSGY